MKLKKIITLTLVLIFSQSSFATGSDGGNSGTSVPPESNENTMQVCVVVGSTEELVCTVINTDSED